jgi:hypothetical protein
MSSKALLATAALVLASTTDAAMFSPQIMNQFKNCFTTNSYPPTVYCDGKRISGPTAPQPTSISSLSVVSNIPHNTIPTVNL